MQTLIRGFVGLSLLATGYLLGTAGSLAPVTAQAQPNDTGLTDETVDKIKAAYEALTSAMAALEAEGKYTSATTGVNSFGITVGGVDAIADLKSGRGVDPETFAALYAGKAIEEIKDDLSKDAEGRLTYKNKLVRIYPISTLKRLLEKRAALVGEEDGEGLSP